VRWSWETSPFNEHAGEGLIGTQPLLFVGKVKRPGFEVHHKALSDLGGGKAVRVCLGMVWLGAARRSRCGNARLGRVRLGGHGMSRLGGAWSGGQG